MDYAKYDPKEILPEINGDDELFNWVYQHVHALYAEHWSRLYDRAPATAISLAIMLTYQAIQIAIHAHLPEDPESAEETDDDDDDNLSNSNS